MNIIAHFYDGLLHLDNSVYSPLALESPSDYRFDKWKIESNKIVSYLSQFLDLCLSKNLHQDYNKRCFIGGNKNYAFSLGDIFYKDNNKNLNYLFRLQKDINKIKNCANYLKFGKDYQGNYRLIEARFCRNRLCPLCSWRRRLALGARFLQNWYKFSKDKNLKFLFLTLTTQSCSPAGLADHIKKMQNAYIKLIGGYSNKRFIVNKYNRFIRGSIRAFEVTRSESIYLEDHTWAFRESCHPHIHSILAVDSSYDKFSDSYLFHNNLTCNIDQVCTDKINNNPGWVSLWYYCLGGSSFQSDHPFVNVQYLGSFQESENLIKNKVFETVKYITKPINTKDQKKIFERVDQFVNPYLSGKYLSELHFQLYRKKLFGSYGVLNFLKEDDQDLIKINKDQSDHYSDDNIYTFNYLSKVDKAKGYYLKVG
jgi:hypothetical protein